MIMGSTTIAKNPKGGQPGNANATRHGFYSHDKNTLQLRARAVRRLVNKAYEVAPWLSPTDMPTVRSWAELAKLKAAAFAVLEKVGPYRVDGNDVSARRLLKEYMRLSALELSYARELGFTPAARVSLGVHQLIAQDLATRVASARGAGE